MPRPESGCSVRPGWRGPGDGLERGDQIPNTRPGRFETGGIAAAGAGDIGHDWSFEAIGTQWSITTWAPLEVATKTVISDRIEAVDRCWSRFRPDSMVSRAAASGGSWTLDSSADPLLAFYHELHTLSDGAVSPMVGARLNDLGYGADYSLRRASKVRDVPSWDLVQWRPPNLTLREPVLLDVGAAGKGFVIDLVAEQLAASGHLHFTVDASGDLLHRGEWPLRVGLVDPRNSSRAVGIVELSSGGALCASATDKRAWGEGLHHVLDARSGEPTRDVLATWVMGSDAMVCDGLATALFFVDPALIERRWAVQWALLEASGRLRWSREFALEVL